MDEPGHGGANYEYDIHGGSFPVLEIIFQNGPIKEVGSNGITEAALLAVLIDRLRSFQAGPYACDQNAAALDAGKDMLFALQERTRLRLARKVEGTSTV